MIDSVIMRGFRRFRDRTVELERVTTLAGRSGSGKSTVLRALRWVALNRPAGDGVVCWDADAAEVEVKVDGRAVARRRGSAVNEYELDGAVYRSFGADVPEDVATVLNLGPVNFGTQHAAPFLFGLTPGAVAAELNAVVRLDRIDAVTSDLAAEGRKAKAAIGATEERLKAAEARAACLAWVPDADADLKAMESAFEGSERLSRIVSRAVDLVGDVKPISDRLRRSRVALDGFSAGSAAVDVALERADELKRRRGDASIKVTRARRLAGQLTEARSRAAAASATLAEAAKGRCPVCGKEQYDYA